MNQEQGLQTWPTPRPTRATTRTVVPVLIAVPELPDSSRGRGWTSFSTRARDGFPGRVRARPRRRLRREVRMAGYGMMAVMALAWVPRVFPGAGPDPAPRSEWAAGYRGDGCATYAVAPAPAIRISIEPAGLAPCAGAGAPVVFPGYLLPDDGCEEPAHAGS